MHPTAAEPESSVAPEPGIQTAAGTQAPMAGNPTMAGLPTDDPLPLVEQGLQINDDDSSAPPEIILQNLINEGAKIRGINRGTNGEFALIGVDHNVCIPLPMHFR